MTDGMLLREAMSDPMLENYQVLKQEIVGLLHPNICNCPENDLGLMLKVTYVKIYLSITDHSS